MLNSGSAGELTTLNRHCSGWKLYS